ncbi:MAG: hypothetical protein HN392_00330 [Anaerolineae bacterium]|jgi:hypothetical protein|nr:hypothetical protein [Anaerolineae bacterium]
MSKRKKKRSTPKERFDLNSVIVAGTVIKLWGRGEDVFARLRVSTRRKIEEAEDNFVSYVNLRFPEGEVQGNPVSLSPGVQVRIAGFLTHTSYHERILKFLDAAGAKDFLEGVSEEDLSAWRSINFLRRNAMLNVLGIHWIGSDAEFGKGKLAENKENNNVSLEGVVARVWEYRYKEGVHTFARLACYDRWTPIVSGVKDHFGRPRRKPHYLTVKLPDGKAGGVPVKLEKKMRVRVTGKMADQGERVTLREKLLDMGSESIIQLMARLPNADKMGEISAQQASLHIEAEALIVYSRSKKGLGS